VTNLVDSCGWIEYFTDGPNASFFAPAVNDLRNLVVPTICLTEVFKVVYRQFGRTTALENIASMKLGRVVAMDLEIALAAGKLSADHKLHLADSIILATARATRGRIWTEDAHLKDFPEVNFIGKK
jgi:toxin FitB